MINILTKEQYDAKPGKKRKRKKKTARELAIQEHHEEEFKAGIL